MSEDGITHFAITKACRLCSFVYVMRPSTHVKNTPPDIMITYNAITDIHKRLNVSMYVYEQKHDNGLCAVNLNVITGPHDMHEKKKTKSTYARNIIHNTY